MDSANRIVTSYTFGVARLVTAEGNTVTFELNDRIGSVRLVTDSGGNIIKSFNYDAFGAIR
jgi:hypothetical protein